MMPQSTPDLPAAEMDDIQDKLITVQAALIKRLETERDALKAALMPFALAAEDGSVKQAGEEYVLHIGLSTEPRHIPIFINGNTPDWKFLDKSHLRAAAKALRITSDTSPVTHEEDGT